MDSVPFVPFVSFHLFRETIIGTRSIISKFEYRILFKLSNSKIGTRVTYSTSLDEFLCAKFEISLETQENISKSINYTQHGRLSQNLSIEFSLNYPDVKMGTRVTHCAS